MKNLMEMWQLLWRCGGFDGDVVALMEMWWLKWRCGGSNGDVVALMEMWWFLWRCGGSLVAHQTSGAEVLGSNPASPIMILGHCRIIV